MLNIIQLPVLENNYIFIIHEPESGETAVVDPAIAAPVLATLRQRQWSLKYILNTHHHWDHIGANVELKQVTGCQIAASAFDQQRIPGVDISLKEGDYVMLGALPLVIIDTPGHTLGHIAYYSAKASALFCGDTLFAMGCGRLFEGSAEQLWRSLQKFKALPKNTQVYCAHEYTQNNGYFALRVEPGNLSLQQRMTQVNKQRQQHLTTIPTTINAELATNPFFREDSIALQQYLNMQGKSSLAIFTALRRLKDSF
ncbi:MAG: hydroxyacylglutathione hydrolase [Methylococcaceae bacterium]|nr:hydroxyacylglutathione hydrolase [Methylococcaceae bacterium]